METKHGGEGILAEEMKEQREKVVELLKTVYFMELETRSDRGCKHTDCAHYSRGLQGESGREEGS